MTTLPLAATPLHARFAPQGDGEPFIARVSRNPDDPDRARAAWLAAPDARPSDGFAAWLVPAGCESPIQTEGRTVVIRLPSGFDHIADGDIVRINPRRGELWLMYRRSARSNSILVTERCNSFCVMCSQPPKAHDDLDLLQVWENAIPLIDPETSSLGITGGEPTLLGDRLLALLRTCRLHLPSTFLHMLTNGRMCNYLSFARDLADATNKRFLACVPLYSDVAWRHDFIVQAPGAFDQTIRGLLNLARCGVPVEIRVVVHRMTVGQLGPLAEFIRRNLPFARHVALMGLEPIGFGRANLEALWIDPADTIDELRTAVRTLNSARTEVSIYNYPLCVLPVELHPFSQMSISEWKNIFLPVCEDCGARDRCCGFFHSASNAHSRAIRPFPKSVESESPPSVTV